MKCGYILVILVTETNEPGDRIKILYGSCVEDGGEKLPPGAAVSEGKGNKKWTVPEEDRKSIQITKAVVGQPTSAEKQKGKHGFSQASWWGGGELQKPHSEGKASQ